ncbi:MAG: hypothetical protein KGL52_05605 [Rhodospirillales bacterium]|nr:hypothetical protein [Rhodospirillales bacterium]
MTDASNQDPARHYFATEPDMAFRRRLSDKVLLAFHQACEQRDIAVARQLIKVLEFMWERDLDAPWGRRRNVNFLVPARERLLHLLYLSDRHAAQPEQPTGEHNSTGRASRNDTGGAPIEPDRAGDAMNASGAATGGSAVAPGCPGSPRPAGQAMAARTPWS